MVNEAGTIIITWPSGGDFATYEYAMLPPPPGLFSTTAGWPRLACRPVAISRATTSLEPPGVNGTMMRMVLLGKRACAPATSGHAARPPSVAINARRDL